MSKAQHTLGPWSLREKGDPWHIFGPNMEAIASINQWSGDTKENQHQAQKNAKFIAAAPDMAEALKGVLRVADRKTVEFDAVRAALAKAGVE